jgi:hypothetical protein
MKNTIRLLSLALVLAAMPAFAQTHDYTSTGNNGRVNSDAQSLVLFGGPSLKFQSASTGTIKAYYPVTNTHGSGSTKTPAWTTFWSTYRDSDANGSVTSALFEVDKCTGVQTQICSITSSGSGSSAQCSNCSFSSSTFDFANHTYYILVTLARTSTSSNQEIHSLAVN